MLCISQEAFGVTCAVLCGSYPTLPPVSILVYRSHYPAVPLVGGVRGDVCRALRQLPGLRLLELLPTKCQQRVRAAAASMSHLLLFLIIMV